MATLSTGLRCFHRQWPLGDGGRERVNQSRMRLGPGTGYRHNEGRQEGGAGHHTNTAQPGSRGHGGRYQRPDGFGWETILGTNNVNCADDTICKFKPLFRPKCIFCTKAKYGEGEGTCWLPTSAPLQTVCGCVLIGRR